MVFRVCARLFKSKSAINSHFFKRKNLAFSTEASAVVEEKLPRFRTLENNPSRHDENHIGKFYTIKPEIKTALFHGGGIPRSLDLQMTTFRESCIMVRKPAVEIITYLKNMNYAFPAVRFVIYGANGVGKSSALIHILHFGFLEKYLLLHVPWVSHWTKTLKEIVDSESRPGRYDLPMPSTLWLQHFKSQNSELLKTIDLKTSQTYIWSQREQTEAGQPLTNVIEQGLNRGRHASDCVAVLLKEIKQQSSSGKFKTLVVIDGVNAFYCPGNTHFYKKSDKTPIKPIEVTIIRAFEKIIKNDWNNAAVVTTVDSMPQNSDEKIVIPFTPRALLGKEGFEILDPFIPVLAENYTEKEIESVLDYYVDRLWLQTEEARSEKGRAELRFLSGYNPYQLMKLCDSL